MRAGMMVAIGVTAAMCAAGCKAPTRIATRVTDLPRVDLDLSGGNRGYLLGTPPEPGEMKTTRQMIETDIEIPSFYKPKAGGAPAPLATTPSGSGAVRVGGSPAAAATAGPMDSYVVKRGESLWTIAARPEIYGKAMRWKRIFEANRDILKDPNSVREGMTLRIPRGDAPRSRRGRSEDDGGTTFAK